MNLVIKDADVVVMGDSSIVLTNRFSKQFNKSQILMPKQSMLFPSQRGFIRRMILSFMSVNVYVKNSMVGVMAMMTVLGHDLSSQF